MNKTAIIILAAGQSKRLGTPKQLLVFKGKKLLCHVVDTAIETNLFPIYVVLGCKYEEMKKTLSHDNIQVVENKNWAEGMASSVVIGLKKVLENHPTTERVIFMVCDQPFLSSELLTSLVRKHTETLMPIVASQYNHVLGTPALFHSSMFQHLLQLQGDVGAGKVIKQFPDKIVSIDFPDGMKDIDTQEDLPLLQEPTCS